MVGWQGLHADDIIRAAPLDRSLHLSKSCYLALRVRMAVRRCMMGGCRDSKTVIVL